MTLFSQEPFKPLHQQLRLYIDGEESYIFVPEKGRNLVVHRNTGDLSLMLQGTSLPRSARHTETVIHGILGMISLSNSDYIVLLTGREVCGTIFGKHIYRARDFKLLPIDASPTTMQHPVEGHLLALVHSHLFGGTFFFSYEWDLTRRIQDQWAKSKDDAGRGFWEVADNRFFWNKFLQSRLIDFTQAHADQDLSSYILPMIYGSFDARRTSLNGRSLRFIVISRRSRYRPGTRYFRRGIDHEGHVANFNESEQILIYDDRRIMTGTWNEVGTIMSFVQIRGSVPLYWAEINTLRYKPDLQVMELHDSVDAMRTHLQEQVRIYGATQLVNLVNQKGHEKPVKEAYERNVKQANVLGVKYEYFDFHTECKKMRFGRVSLLVERIQDELVKNGYFHFDPSKPEPVMLQTGCVRTNCMDNLDRTNVVQSALAKWTLDRQLRTIHVLTDHESVEEHSDFLAEFREAWADHGDTISSAYAGTGALKAGFTRTGKRSWHGVLDDGKKSVVRYLKNNFFDGSRQDAFDLISGAWQPRQPPYTANSLITDTRPLLIRSVPYVVSFSAFMILAGLTLPRTSDYSLRYYFFLWFLLLFVSLAFVFAHGIDYVTWPRLLPLTDVIYYEGPGERKGRHGKGFITHDAKTGRPHMTRLNSHMLSSGRKRSYSYAHELELGTRKRED